MSSRREPAARGVQHKRRRRLARRLLGVTGLLIVCAALFSASALGAYDYVYKNGYIGAGGVASDFQVVYRNYNDACSGDGYGNVGAIYGRSDGTWIVHVSAFSNCTWGGKAHLGPTTNYGVTYAQSKCRNDDIQLLFLHCNTTRPS